MVPVLLLCLGLAAAGPTRVVEIDVSSRQEVSRLPRGLDIIDAGPNHVRILVDPGQLELLRDNAYAPRILIDDYAAHLDSVFQDYHTYAQVCSIVRAVAQARPDICRLDTIGQSVRNRAILALRITDNPEFEEAEPEFRITGAHHGDEKISTEVALAFIRYVVASYDTSAAVRDLVDTRELWVIPIVNVDGHVSDSRRNANYVDLNRDYGYEWDDDTPDPFSQVETRHMRRHSMDNNIAVGFDFHSVASYVNYLWDSDSFDPPDSILIAGLAAQYADSTYGSNITRLVPINGYTWYEVHGSCQDACFGLWGILDYTIETRQPSGRTRIDSICLANRRALLAMLEETGYGIYGTVQDSFTSIPLFARVAFSSPERWHVYSDRVLGDYHKPLAPGTYDVTAHAPGYQPRTISGVTVPGRTAVELDFDLVPDTTGFNAVEEVAWTGFGDPYHVIFTWGSAMLGPPDGRFHSIGRRGIVCLSAGDEPVRNLPGADVFVHDGDSVPEGYWVYASSDWDGPWSLLGNGSGTDSFDLAQPGLDSCLFLRIASDSSGSTSNPRAGLDLDAVTWRTTPTSIEERQPAEPGIAAVWPSPATNRVHVRARPGATVKMLDSSGRLVESLRARETNLTLDLRARGLEPGVYFVLLESPGLSGRHKVVVTGTGH
jgi:hypothetical protein